MSNIQSTNANALVKKDYVDKTITNTITQSLLNSIYPVGSVMLRYDNINPNTIPGLINTKWRSMYMQQRPSSGLPQPGVYFENNSYLRIMFWERIS